MLTYHLTHLGHLTYQAGQASKGGSLAAWSQRTKRRHLTRRCRMAAGQEDEARLPLYEATAPL